MIQAFKRSRISYAAVLVLSCIIAVAVWFRDRNYPFFIPLIASALTLGIGYVGARLLGNILAGTENTKVLGYLHVELDPQKFIRHYQEVPQRVKNESNAAICRSYLADGYAAGGDYETAISLLSVAPPASDLGVQGLYAANLAGCYLHLGNAEAAKPYLERLNQIIDACRLDKAGLAKNLMEMDRIHKNHLACLTGQTVDKTWLEDAFQNAQYNLRRLEIQKILAMTAIRDGDNAPREACLHYLLENGGQTVYRRWAEQQN